MGSKLWYEGLDLSKLGPEDRVRLLRYAVDRYGADRVLEALGVSKVTLWRLLNSKSPVDNEKLLRVLQLLTPAEFESAVGAAKRLVAAGILRKDGTVDYAAALEVLALAARDEYLKQALLRFTVENFREDLRRMLGLSLAHVVFRWEPGFEEFLRERKKRRRVTDPETVAYYRNLFKRYLEGRTLSEELVNYVINHENRWLRNVFRHYVQYLYYMRRIPPETYGWLMEVVPSRSYRLDVRTYPIDLNDVVRTLSTLREEHDLYYLVYRLMLEGGLRLSHALLVVRSFNPGEVVEVPGVDLETERLVCFEPRGFCRYYVGIRESAKPCEWAYLSTTTLELLEEYAGAKVDRRPLERFVSRRNLLLPKYMRKVAWRLMVRVMPREVARFMQSRFGELKVSEARYEDLLSEADTYYPKYLSHLRELRL
ncbi:MAG: integrase [Desulfurococcaceae archaeon]|nr:integrase [Desulfurococcaceae archaeon]